MQQYSGMTISEEKKYEKLVEEYLVKREKEDKEDEKREFENEMKEFKKRKFETEIAEYPLEPIEPTILEPTIRIPKKSIREAIREARECDEGDLILNDDNSVSFLIGYSNSITHNIIVKDFWYYVQKMTADEIIKMVQKNKAYPKEWL